MKKVQRETKAQAIMRASIKSGKLNQHPQLVILAFGGWTCPAGYSHWAYIAEVLPGKLIGETVPCRSHQGKRLYTPKQQMEPFNTPPGHFKTPMHRCLDWLKCHPQYTLYTPKGGY